MEQSDLGPYNIVCNIVYLRSFINRLEKQVYDKGAQKLSDRVLDSRQRGCGFELHQRHCIVVLEQDTFILA